MKFKKSALLVACAMVASASALALAACSGEADTITVDWTVLSAPTNVSVTYGDDSYSSEDDYVTFDAVDGAVEYRVYVYQDGDETAKVTSGTDTTIEMPTPLDAGTYNVSVIAVGDQLTTYNSVGSDVVSYTLDELVQTKLGTPTGLSLDLSEGVISFTGDANAQSYIVNVYETESDYSYDTSDTPATYFNIPGGDTDIEYTIPDETLDDLTPGYFAFTVQALGDDYYYSDGDTAEGTTLWTYGKYITPEISVESSFEKNYGPSSVSLSGAIVFVENYEDYFVGTTFTVNAYTDEDCTELAATTYFSYASATSFGITIVTNYVAFTVAEEETDGALTVGTTYYFQVLVEGDDVIYETSDPSNIVSLTPESTASGTGSSSSSSSSATATEGTTINVENASGSNIVSGSCASSAFYLAGQVDVDVSDNAGVFAFYISDNAVTITCSQTTTSEGSAYSFSISDSSGGLSGTVECLEADDDGNLVVVISIDGGPYSECVIQGTYTVSEDGTTLSLDFGD